jgi:HSP20 family protein
MLGSFKEFGRGIGRELSRAWENLAERLARASDSIWKRAYSFRAQGGEGGGRSEFNSRPSSELGLTGGGGDGNGQICRRSDRAAWHAARRVGHHGRGQYPHLRGEKRMNREYISASYHLMERAYGSFERVIPLPRYVDPRRCGGVL